LKPIERSELVNVTEVYASRVFGLGRAYLIALDYDSSLMPQLSVRDSGTVYSAQQFTLPGDGVIGVIGFFDELSDDMKTAYFWITFVTEHNSKIGQIKIPINELDEHVKIYDIFTDFVKPEFEASDERIQ
jgi:hypothetical protein